MNVKSIRGRSPEEIQRALDKAISHPSPSGGPGFKPSLAIVFLTRPEDIDAITAILNGENLALFGASTSRQFSEQGIDEEGIVVLLMDMNPACFRIVLRDFKTSGSVYQAASAVGEAGKNSFKHPAFIISTSDIATPGEEVIKGILDKAGANVPVIGGGSGEHINFTGVVFTNEGQSGAGIVALILDEDKIDAKGVAVSGWKPVGTEKKITKCNGNWVYTIDDQPAMDVIRKFLGREMLAIDKSAGLDSYPLQVERPSGKPMMRPVVLWNEEDHSVMLGGPVKEGSRFRFSLPPDLEVIDTVIESAKAIKEKELPEADTMIVFSCIGRLSSLGPMVDSEIEGLAAVWKTPMAGFFSLGEYGKLDDTRPEFHGTTVSWVALKEKQDAAGPE